MEKCREEKASTKINTSTSLKLDEDGSIISGDSDSSDTNAENDPKNLEFVFPSNSSGTTGSTRLRSESLSPLCSSITLKLPRNPFTSKIISFFIYHLVNEQHLWGAILSEGVFSL